MYNTKSVIDMSVFDDIMKQKSQQIKPNLPANQQPSTAAVAQPAQTGFTAPKQVTVEDMTKAVTTPTQAQKAPAAQPAPAVTPAARPQQLSYVDMLNKMYTPETAEEKAKRERKEKWDKTAAAIGDGISALANLYYTTKGAPNSYDGKNSMSERTRQLYERLDKDRKENERWYLNHYMNAAKMDADEAKAERSWKNTLEMQKQAQENADRNFEAQEKQRKWQREHAEQQAQFQQSNADWQHANTEQQQAEQKRQFWANHNLSVQNYNRQLEKENEPVNFVLGNGKTATVKKQNIHTHNVSYVYNKLPKEVRDQYAQEPSYDKDGKPVETYKKDANGKYVKDANGNYIKEPVMKARKLNDSDKMAIIGEHIANYPEVQNAWKEIGGEITTSTQQSGGGKKHSHRVGGNNSGTTDV